MEPETASKWNITIINARDKGKPSIESRAMLRWTLASDVSVRRSYLVESWEMRFDDSISSKGHRAVFDRLRELD